MKTLLLIGIGAGDPEHITVQGINALNRANVLFVLDKGQATEDLVRMRLQICQRYIREPGYRVVQVNDPQRDSSTACYTDGVEDWHQQRAEVFTHLIEDQLADGECGAFLLWGDPGLYDSTLRILDRVRAGGCSDFEHEVIPGIRPWPRAIALRSTLSASRSASPPDASWWPRIWIMSWSCSTHIVPLKPLSMKMSISIGAPISALRTRF